MGGVNAAKFSPDGNFFSSGGSDKLVMVWKANLNDSIPAHWDAPTSALVTISSSFCSSN